jgi:hypothetical protein
MHVLDCCRSFTPWLGQAAGSGWHLASSSTSSCTCAHQLRAQLTGGRSAAVASAAAAVRASVGKSMTAVCKRVSSHLAQQPAILGNTAAAVGCEHTHWQCTGLHACISMSRRQNREAQHPWGREVPAAGAHLTSRHVTSRHLTYPRPHLASPACTQGARRSSGSWRCSGQRRRGASGRPWATCTPPTAPTCAPRAPPCCPARTTSRRRRRTLCCRCTQVREVGRWLGAAAESCR